MPTILVADDYQVTQRVLGAQLRRGGYEVSIVSNGLEALESLNERLYDLAILDISMPDMDGLTVLTTLRDDEKYDEMPIVMLTASGQDSDRIEAKAKGANAFLTKPVSSWELLEVVREFAPQTA